MIWFPNQHPHMQTNIYIGSVDRLYNLMHIYYISDQLKGTIGIMSTISQENTVCMSPFFPIFILVLFLLFSKYF